MLLPSNLLTNYMSAGDSTSGLSGNLWSRINAPVNPFGKRAVFVYDDFLLFGQSVAVSSNVGCYASLAGQYKSYEGASATLAQLATATGGVIQLGLPATDNLLCAICQGGAGTSAAASVLGALNRDTNPRRTIFETRFRVSSVADDVMAIFLGLAEENAAVAASKDDNTGVTAGGAVSVDLDFIGFDTVHTNSGTTGTNAVLRAVYNKNGAAQVTPIATLQTMVASTWYKAGFDYNPAAPASKKISFFIDNVEQSTYVTDAQMNASTFPDGEEMGFTAMTKSGSAATSNLQIDWWAYYQEID
jgi:hypothetical protein